MKKIFLSVIIALSFQTIAQTSSLDMIKILEPSKEEQERRYYKELNAQINPPLIHDEKAPLVTEEKCFEDAYDELKKYMERIENESNTKYRGYENQVKQLTEFTNKKARGMGCKKATLFYKRELWDNLRSFVEREAKNQERIEQIIAQDKEANLKQAEEYEKMEEEKEFNSNPKNFPYKENWFDYEIKLTEITDQGQIQNIKNKYTNEIMKYRCDNERSSNYEKSIDDIETLHFYDYSFEEVNGFFENIDEFKLLKINTPFVNELFFKKHFSTLDISPDSTLHIRLTSVPEEKIEYHLNTELKYLTMEHSIELGIDNKNQKIYIETQLDPSSSVTTGAYFRKNKENFPENYYKTALDNYFTDKIFFRGTNLNENILFLKNNCF